MKRALSLASMTLAAVVTAFANTADESVEPTSDSRLVILHTNDTHSRIDPLDNGRGGILRRKVVVDSVRNANRNVMVIDAGDAVQGTLYYSLFLGEVERKLMNAIGYDIQILGNHEFDNGLAVLAREWRQLNAEKLSTNYDVRNTPLDSIIKPYTIREFDGRRIGFLAINLDPEGMISANNSRGVVYLDAIKAANSTAWHLKHNERCDLVVAVTHVGYTSSHGPGDRQLAEASEDIDIIIGGHSHTVVDPADDQTPPSLAVNAVGDTILVAQTGALGVNVGEIDIDLATLRPTYKLIAVDGRLDSRVDPAFRAILDPYRNSVDSILTIKIAHAPEALTKESWSLVNYVSDAVGTIGERLAGHPIDIALMNRGGIRCDLPAGDVTQGLMMQMLPFDNRIVVIEISGADLADAFDVMASRGGDGISDGSSATVDRATRRASDIVVNGKPIDPARTYTVATIDYLAQGGDYMAPLKKATEIAHSSNILYGDIIDYMKQTAAAGREITARPGARMTAK